MRPTFKSQIPPFKGKARDITEWRSHGHPCPDYPAYKKQKEKENLDKRWEALEKMRPRRADPEKLKNAPEWFRLPRPPEAEPVESSPLNGDETQHRVDPVKIENRPEPLESSPTKSRSKRILVVTFGMLVIILLILIFLVAAGIAR